MACGKLCILLLPSRWVVLDRPLCGSSHILLLCLLLRQLSQEPVSLNQTPLTPLFEASAGSTSSSTCSSIASSSISGWHPGSPARILRFPGLGPRACLSCSLHFSLDRFFFVNRVSFRFRAKHQKQENLIGCHKKKPGGLVKTVLLGFEDSMWKTRAPFFLWLKTALFMASLSCSASAIRLELQRQDYCTLLSPNTQLSKQRCCPVHSMVLC